MHANLEWHCCLDQRTADALLTIQLQVILAREFLGSNLNRYWFVITDVVAAFPFPTVVTHHKEEEHHKEGIDVVEVDPRTCLEVAHPNSLGSLASLVVHTDEVAYHILTLDFRSSQMEAEVAFHLTSCFASLHTCCLHPSDLHRNSSLEDRLRLVDVRTPIHFRNQSEVVNFYFGYHLELVFVLHSST